MPARKRLASCCRPCTFSKGKPKICIPRSSHTDEPKTAKIGMGHLDPYLTASAKFGYDRSTGAGGAENPFHVDFGFSIFILFLFFSLFL
jgi:hypothetical protein